MQPDAVETLRSDVGRAVEAFDSGASRGVEEFDLGVRRANESSDYGVGRTVESPDLVVTGDCRRRTFRAFPRSVHVLTSQSITDTVRKTEPAKSLSGVAVSRPYNPPKGQHKCRGACVDPDLRLQIGLNNSSRSSTNSASAPCGFHFTHFRSAAGDWLSGVHTSTTFRSGSTIQ